MRVLLTGAAGGMGLESLKQMAADGGAYKITALDLDNDRCRKRLRPYEENPRVKILFGDLTDADLVEKAVQGCDLILHIAAFVSPAADYDPKKAMQINFGGTCNLIEAVKKLGQQDTTRFVYIGTVAETGDRMPPIHWGRVGDPIKPSMFDYYAVSKVAAERYVIESGLKYWVSLRQTGIIGPAMAKIRDAIQFHNCLDNVLEYASDRDSGRLMRNLAAFEAEGTLDGSFWGHIYNIGGGASCRVDTLTMYKLMYVEIGIKNIDYVIDPKVNATRNFHGKYYLDSDKLEDYLHFRSDSMQYFYDAYLKELGAAKPFGKIICKLPGGQKLMGGIIKSTFKKHLNSEHGTKHFIDANMEDHIEAYWGSRKAWEALPEKTSEMQHSPIGTRSCISITVMTNRSPKASCPSRTCGARQPSAAASCFPKRWKRATGSQNSVSAARSGTNSRQARGSCWRAGIGARNASAKAGITARAKVDPFFAQVWDPLHAPDELREYPKEVTELDV